MGKHDGDYQDRKKAMWRGRVVSLLREGYGAEDIAIITQADPDAVRLEIQILRDEGYLARVFRGRVNA